MSDLPLDQITKGTAVLIGASTFPKDPDNLRPLPQVESNLADLERVLVSRKYVGMNGDKVHRLLNIAQPHEVLVTAAGLARDETEALVVYYAGHGLLSDNNSLLLTGPQSIRDLAEESSMSWESLKSIVRKSKAANKVVILDCCFSGHASSMGVDADTVLRQLETKGTVVLASSPKNKESLAREEDRLTVFTGGLLATVEAGIQEAGITLDIGDLFNECKRRMGAEQAPEPQLLNHGSAKEFPFCNNMADLGTAKPELATPAAAAAEQRGLNLATVEALRNCVTYSQDPKDRRTWRSDHHPQRFAQNLEIVLSATVDALSPSSEEMAVAYAALLLNEVRLDRAIAETPAFAEMRKTGRWPREFVAVQATTERLVERCADLSKSAEVRAAIEEWVVGYALLTAATAWEDDQVKDAASKLAGVLALDEQDRQELAGQLLSAAKSIQRGSPPVHALEDKWPYVSAATGSNEFIHWKLIYELGVVLREMNFNVYRHGRELVEQLGIVESFSMDSLLRDLELVRWAKDDNGNPALVAKCFDPAVEETMKSYVERFRDLKQTLPDTSSSESLRRFVLLPATADGVGPRRVDGKAVYSPPITRLTLNSDKIRQLLMGEQLYGQPRLAMRELYQNSLDACRYREYRHKYLGHKGISVPQWSPVIKFESVYADDGALLRLDCIDNGVGMQKHVLEYCFLNAGSRFVETVSFADEQANWLKEDEGLRLTPNSAFGIGAFSYFMLADAVQVWTRPQNTDGTLGPVLRLLINAGSSIARVFEEGGVPHGLRDGGTVVQLYLRPEFRSVSQLQLRNFIDDTVLYSPMRLETVEGDENITREPGEVSPNAQSSGSVAWSKEDSKAWWAERTAPVLADGLITATELTGIMATLHGSHKPMLRVDRNDIVHWDMDWVLDRTAESAETLSDWDGLSLQWLWSFSEAYPRHGARLVERLKDIRPIVPLGQSKYWNREVDIRAVGCFPGDKYLIKELSDHRFATHYPPPLMPEVFHSGDHTQFSAEEIFPSCLKPWRRRVWQDALPEIFEDWSESSRFLGAVRSESEFVPKRYRFPVWEPEQLNGIAHPDPIDAALMVSITDGRTGFGEPIDARSCFVDIVALIHGAARSRIGLGQAVERLSRFARFSLLGIPSVPEDSIDYIPNQRDCLLVTAIDAAWTAERDVAGVDYLELIPVCQELSLSLREACEALETLLRRVGVSCPSVSSVLGASANHVPTAREVRFFGFGKYDDGSELRYSEGTRGAFAGAVERAGMSRREVADTIDRYTPFGMERYLAIQDLPEIAPPDRKLAKAWSANFDERAPWIDEQLYGLRYTPFHPSTPEELLIHALFFAFLNKVSLREAVQMIALFPGLSAEQRNIADLAVPPIVPLEIDLRLLRQRVGLSQSYRGGSLPVVSPGELALWRFSPLELKVAALEEDVALEFVIDRLRNFEILGVAVPDCDVSILKEYDFTSLELNLLTTESSSLSGFGARRAPGKRAAVVRPIPPLHVLEVACAERTQVGVVVASLDKLSVLDVASDCNSLPDVLESYVPTDFDVQMAWQFKKDDIGMVICREAQVRGCSIGDTIDKMSKWGSWLLGISFSELQGKLEAIRLGCGELVPNYFEVSFYCAVSGQAKLSDGRFTLGGALTVAAQGNVSVKSVIESFGRFASLFSVDGITAGDLDACPEEVASLVPDSRWVIAASEGAVVGEHAAEVRARLGGTNAVATAALKSLGLGR